MPGFYGQGANQPSGFGLPQRPGIQAAPAAPTVAPRGAKPAIYRGSPGIATAAPGAQSVAPVAHVAGATPQIAPPAAAPVLPYHVAQSNLLNQQASSAIAAHSPINDTARADANNAARLGLFKQYHNGLAPGEFQAMQRAQQLQGPYDPFRDRMVQQASHPAYLNQGGTASYRGVVPFDGPSIADRNTEIANNAGSRVAAYDLAKSQARAADPYTQLDVAGELARDRSKAGAMIAINRGDPNLANAIPASTEGESEPMRNPSADLFSGAIGHAGSPRANNPINAANFEEILAQNPATRDLGEMLGKAETPLHEKAQYFASTPGANDPNSPVRQAWDAFMNSQLARGQAFQNELGQYNPLGEGHSSAPTHQSLVSRILGINPEWSPGNLLRQAMGYQQAETFRNQQFADNMAKLGYAPANNGVRSVPLFGAVQ